MRVLLDGRVTSGGVGTYARDLLAGLSSVEGVQSVTVGFPESTGRISEMTFTPWGRAAVARRAAREGVEVLHGLHLEVPRSAIPTVVTLHDLIPIDHPSSMPSALRRAVFRSILRRTLDRAQRIIVPSTSTRRALERWRAAPPVDVIPHGVSARFRPLEDGERETARRRFGSGGRYVAAIASPKPHKNARTSFRAGELLKEKTGIPIVHAGHAPAGSPSGALGTLSDDDLRTFLAGAEIFLSTSLIEGFGLPALEALACGTPVVCGTGLGALPFLSRAADVVDVMDDDAVARALVALMADDGRRAEMTRAGLAIAGELTVAKMAERTVTVYRRLVDA